MVNKVSAKAIKFDSYFEKLLVDLQNHSIISLIATAPCPDCAGPDRRSVLFAKIPSKAKPSYDDIIGYLQTNRERFNVIDVEVGGISDEKFKIKIWAYTEIPIEKATTDSLKFEAAQYFTTALKEKIFALRDYIVTMSLQTTDLSSFFHKSITEGLRSFLDFEGASAFYFDYPSDSLVLGATTGLKKFSETPIKGRDSLGLRRTAVRYFSTSKSWVRRCFEVDRPLCEFADTGETLPVNTFGEAIPAIKNRFYFPINLRQKLKDSLIKGYGPELSQTGKIGVLRIANSRRNGYINPISVIDYHFLSHFLEYIAVLGARYIKALSALHDQEKATHGFITDLSTLKMRMQLFGLEFSSVMNRVKPNDTPSAATAALVEVSGLLKLFERTFFAVLEGMAFQLETVMHFSEGAFLSTSSEIPLCDKPYVEIVVRATEAAEFIAQNYARRKPAITFYGEKRAPDWFIKMPPLKVPSRIAFLALRNIIENAVKYTRRIEAPEIEIKWRHEGDRLVLTVEDHGIGVDPSDIRFLFAEGFRARNALREATRGNGLGLCVSRKALRSFGGEVRYLGKGHAGSGSIFCIELPTTEPAK